MQPDASLNHLQCKEIICLDNLKAIRNSNELDLTEKHKLNEYYDIQTKHNGIVKYNVGNAKYFNYGRLSVENNVGLQYIPRKIRNTIIRNETNTDFIYIDLDIVNCVPNLLYNFLLLNKDEVFDYLHKEIVRLQQDSMYADTSEKLKANRKINNIEKVIKKQFPYLKKYIYERDEINNEVMSYYNTNRDTTKQLFNSIINGGSFYSWIKKNNLVDDKCDDEPDSIRMFILGFQKEQVIITNYFEYNNNLEGLKLAILKNKLEKQEDYIKVEASLKSIFIYTIETHIISKAFYFLLQKGIIKFEMINNKPVYYLSFEGDGMKLYTQDDTFIDELNEYINTVFNFPNKLQFINKPMKEFYTVDELAEIKANKIQCYDDVKEDFEAHNFKLNDPIMYYELNPRTNELIGRSRADFKYRYENLYYQQYNKEDKLEDKSFIEKWFKDKNIKTYEKLDFYPCRKTPDYIYNTFNGYDGETAPDNNNDFKQSLMYKHFKENICCNNEQREEYLTKWIANLLQDPLNKTRTAMILQSKQGCGKDFFVEFLNILLGNDYYIITSKTEQVFGKFNKLIENKVLCVFNETQGKDTFEINESIKDAITRQTINVERKCKDAVTMNDATHCIFLSNNNNPVKIPPDDRRFFCIEVGEGNKNDIDFFARLKKELISKEYIKSFYNYFKNIDISGYDFHSNRPDSENYELMRETNVPVLVRFLEDFIKNLYFQFEDGKRLIFKDEIKIRATQFYNKFKDFKAEKNYKIEMSQTKFGIDIKRYSGVTKKENMKGTEYTVNIKQIMQILQTEYRIEFVEYNEEETFD